MYRLNYGKELWSPSWIEKISPVAFLKLVPEEITTTTSQLFWTKEEAEKALREYLDWMVECAENSVKNRQAARAKSLELLDVP